MIRFFRHVASTFGLFLLSGQWTWAQNAVSDNSVAVSTMPDAPVSTALPVQQIIASIPHDLSPYGMFMAADWVVKSVMIGLALASVATWTIWIAKSIELSSAKRKARSALKAVQEAGSLSELSMLIKNDRSIGAALVQAAEDEVRASIVAVDAAGSDGLKERLSSVLSRLVSAAGRRMSVGTGPLATIGAIGPFVGLFGTVWGIMNSFIGISQAQTTNLAVVAPGIAEALLATAIGLIAAIPAVVIYNIFARSITGYRQQLVDVSAGIERLVSRDLDSDELEVNHDINVTPFIDVILVLLIIFMVAAPLATSDIPVQLPSAATPAQPKPDKPIYVTLQKDQSLFVGNETATLDNLKSTLDKLTQNNLDAKIFIRGDKGVDYGGLMQLLNQLRAAGYLKIGLVGLESTGAPAQ